MAKAMQEKALQEHVRKRCQTLRLLYYHTHRSTYSPAGYPDTTVVGPTEMLYAELKQVGKKPTPAQREWIESLRRVGHVVYVWTPEHLFSGEIDEVLGALARGGPAPDATLGASA